MEGSQDHLSGRQRTICAPSLGFAKDPGRWLSIRYAALFSRFTYEAIAYYSGNTEDTQTISMTDRCSYVVTE